MKNSQLTKNAGMGVVHALISGCALFLLYRFLLKSIGAEELGIWSILLATASISRMSDLGFSGSASKYTAKYISRGRKDIAAEVVETTAISVASVIGLVFILAYPLIPLILGYILTSDKMQIALEILPYAVFSVWIASISGIFQSGLDGCQRIDIRCSISIGTMIFYLITVWYLVPVYGLKGLAWAQISQNLLIFGANYIYLKKMLPSLRFTRFRWKLNLFKEMMNYGANIQVISLFMLLLDPITKMLLTKFGGLSSATYFEMANRLVNQFRSILISANQAVIPTVANLQESAPDKINALYRKSYDAVGFLSAPLYSSIAIASPIISTFWIGSYNKLFIIYLIILCIGYFINTISSPAYFASMGTGYLRWNTYAHILIGLLNIILGYALGKSWGGVGVVLGFVVALSAGSILQLYGYYYHNKIEIKTIVLNKNSYLYLISLIGMLFEIIKINMKDNSESILIDIFIVILYFFILSYLVYKNILTKLIINKLRNKYKIYNE